MVVASRAREQDGHVLSAAPAEERRTVIKERGERLASGERFVVESELLARYAVCPDEALVVVDGEQQGGRSIVGRQRRDEPFVAEVHAEETLFDRAGRRVGGGEGKPFWV